LFGVRQGGVAVSFVSTTPQVVAEAAGNLAGIGSSLTEATAAAAGATTSVAAAGADEVSLAISQLFGGYGQQFQTLSAQAAAFQAEFVRLLDGGAAAYLATEVANAQQVLLGAVNPPASWGAIPAADLLPGVPLPGVPGVPGTPVIQLPSLPGITLPGLPGLPALPNLLGWLFGPPPPGPGGFAYGTAWQTLFAHTNTNLQTTLGSWAAHPFPVLQQVIANQNFYANTVGTGFVATLQDYPHSLANVPANVQMFLKGVSDTPAALQAYAAKQATSSAATGAALRNFIAHVNERLPAFHYDMGTINDQFSAGDYHGAVDRIPQAFVDLLIDGVDISNLSTVTIHGPAGDLMPLMSQTGAGTQDLVNLLQPGSIPRRIAQNFLNVISTVPTSLGLSLLGPPLSTLDGIATGATELGTAVQTGNPFAVAGALVDFPANVLDGLLNGQPVLDVRIPVSVSFDIPATILPLPPPLDILHVGVGSEVVAHVPFSGLLAQPAPVGATLEVPGVPLLGSVAVDLPFGGDMRYGGLITELLTNTPQKVANAIAQH
jgi:hypothetical protein